MDTGYKAQCAHTLQSNSFLSLPDEVAIQAQLLKFRQSSLWQENQNISCQIFTQTKIKQCGFPVKHHQVSFQLQIFFVRLQRQPRTGDKMLCCDIIYRCSPTTFIGIYRFFILFIYVKMTDQDTSQNSSQKKVYSAF